MSNKESGQTLPMTLAALMLGILITVPFVARAGTSLISSRDYGLIVKEGYASDAGVEHAIWRLTDDNLTASLPNVGNNIIYSLPNPVNNLTPSISVTKTGGGSGSVTGTITDSVTDTLEFDTSQCDEPSIINVSPNIYAVAYRGPSSDGFIKTATIGANGQISNTEIDLLEFDTSDGYWPDIISVSGNIIAIAYGGSGNVGKVITTTVDTNGLIGNAVIDTFTFDASACYKPDIISISGGVFAIVYRGASNRGYVKTLAIAANGVITKTAIDTYTFDAAACYEPVMINVSGPVYAVVYRGNSNGGTVKTLTIATNGIITKTPIDTYVFDAGASYEPVIVRVSGNVYAVAYRNSSNSGIIKTLTIATTGLITRAVLDTQTFDAGRGYEPSLLPVTGSVFAVAYRDQNNRGWVRTWEILTNGQITSGVIDSLQFNATGYQPRIVRVSGDTYAIAYRGPQNDGFLITVGISGPATFQIESVAGGCTITSSVQVSGTDVAINSWVVQRHQ
jgi:hypothetical protein